MDASQDAGPTAGHDRSTDWVDRAAYPFETDCLGLDAGAVHYVDEGPDEPAGTLVMLHGNPTWSFLYRHLIRELCGEYRCVAPDLLGFGLSAYPAGFDYRPASHAAVVADLVDALDLSDVVLVVHDWGGPIGLSYAAAHPGNVRGLVVMNTWAWPLEDSAHFRRFSRLLGGPLGRWLCTRYDAFTRVVMPLGFHDRSALTAAAHGQYLAAHPTPESRRGTWVFPRELTASTPFLRDLWARRERLAPQPTRLLWGMEDRAMREAELRTFEALFDEPSVVRLRGVGHYVPEELGPDLVPYVRSFLAKLD